MFASLFSLWAFEGARNKCATKSVPRACFEVSLARDAIMIVNKFTDSSTYSIWDLIFAKLGYSYHGGKPIPELDDLKAALDSRYIVLIFDELEQGIRIIDKPSIRHQNLAFLQMLSEFSNRSKQVTLFTSIYSDREEPGSTLKRVPCVRVQFSDSLYEDKSNIILHRLFDKPDELDRNRISPVKDLEKTFGKLTLTSLLVGFNLKGVVLAGGTGSRLMPLKRLLHIVAEG